MNITINRTEAETFFIVEGRLDTVTSSSFEKAVNDEGDALKNLVLDFEKLEYISSAGLRVILSAQKKMNKLGTMKLINVCDEVMDVLEMTGFADILNIQ